MNQHQMSIVSRMAALQRLHSNSRKSSPVLFFDIDADRVEDVEKDELITRVQRDYQEDIRTEVDRGISLNAIVVVAVASGAVSVQAINKPYKKR